MEKVEDGVEGIATAICISYKYGHTVTKKDTHSPPQGLFKHHPIVKHS